MYAYVVDEADLRALRVDLRSALARVDQVLDDVGNDAVERDPGEVISLPRTKAIEWMLRDRGEPMRPVQIWSALRELGRDDPKMEIQVTTYDLWQRGRIDKIDRGLYCAIAAEGDDQMDTVRRSADRGPWNIDELRSELSRFQHELRAAELKESSVHTYVDRTERFIRWLDGKYQPNHRSN